MLAVLLLAGCRRAESVQGPQIQATATPTPRSTPLPAVPTLVPPGIEENPIRMVIRPPGSAVARSLITDFQVEQFESALLEETGLVVEVVTVDRYAEALAALCDSSPTQVTVAWLDGLSYQAAVAQDCGAPELLVERDGQSGEQAHIIASAEQNISSMVSLNGTEFCRLGSEDYYSWLIPSLLMQANGVDPLTGLSAVSDYPDEDALVAAVAEGTCATGIAEGDFNQISGALRTDLTLVDSTPPLPYGVLMYPISLPLGERLRLTDGLLALTLDAEASAAMEPFLGQDGLARVDANDFNALTDFLTRTGLDFAQLGR